MNISIKNLGSGVKKVIIKNKISCLDTANVEKKIDVQIIKIPDKIFFWLFRSLIFKN